MEKNSFIGMNPSLARNNINNFVSSVQNNCNNLCNVFGKLFCQLHDNWASPNAVVFYNKFSNSIGEIKTQINSITARVVSNACEAYNVVASANGLGTINVYSNITIKINFQELLSVNNNGSVGMQIENVKEILNTFTASMNKCINEFYSLPKYIALYDDENGMQHSYGTRINELCNTIENFINNVVIEIRNNIQEEIEKTISAKNNATKFLNS